MTWLIYELWGIFAASAVLGAISGYSFRGWLSERSSNNKSALKGQNKAASKKTGKLEGKVIKTTSADVVSDVTMPEAVITNQGNNYAVETVEGIGKTYAKKLRSIGVRQTHDLLDLCRDAEGRERLAKYLKVHTNEVARWNSMADLMRVNGIGGQFAELLEASEVQSIEELMNQKSSSLAKRMAEVNAKTPKTRSLPSADNVADWVKQAKKLQKAA